MVDQSSMAQTFRRLHVPGEPLVIFNAWDAGSAKAVAAAGARAIGAGAIGINLEDGFPDEKGMRDVSAQVARIRAARAAADALSMPLFINARTDYFLQTPPEGHDANLVRAAQDRAEAYRQAGASGLFLPGIFQPEHIRALCASTPLPVNVMMMTTLPAPAELAKLGVARISHGPGPYVAAMEFVEQAAREALAKK